MKKVFRVLAVLVLFNIAFSIDLPSAVIGYAVGSSNNEPQKPKDHVTELVCNSNEEAVILNIPNYEPIYDGIYYDESVGKVVIKETIKESCGNCSGCVHKKTFYSVMDYFTLKIGKKELIRYSVALTDLSFQIRYVYKKEP